MKKITFTLLLLLAATLACAQGNYYDAVIDLSGQPLYTALHSLISTKIIINYCCIRFLISNSYSHFHSSFQ